EPRANGARAAAPLRAPQGRPAAASQPPAQAGANGTCFESAAPVASGAASGPIDLQGAWHELACRLPLTGLAAELARQSEWVGAQGRTVVRRVAVRTLADSAARCRLRAALGAHFGEPVHLQVTIGQTGSGTAHAVAEADRQARQAAAEAVVQSDPFVQSLLRDF